MTMKTPIEKSWRPHLAVVIVLVLTGTMLGCAASKHHSKIRSGGEALRLELAQLYVEKGVHHAAVPLLQRILRENPRDVPARILYANILRDIGLHPQAEREYRFALELAPGYAPAHAGYGILCDLQRKSDAAIKHHLRAVRLSPGNAAYRNNLGFSLYLIGKNDKAIIAFEQTLAMDPGLAVAYNNLGFAYGRKRDFESAEKTFRAALGEASALINMALVYEEHGEAKRAESARHQAYALDPDLQPVDSDDQEIDL